MIEMIKSAFAKYKITLSDEMATNLNTYSNYVLSENEKYNLTAITDKKEFVFKHLLDSALGIDLIPENAKLIDIGSGAGFPGIVLKILRPDIKITLVDALQKRVNFLNSVITMLNLQDIKAIHERSEDLASNYIYREKFDVATARAVAKLATLSEYLLPFVKIGGKMIAYKSKEAYSELQECGAAICILGGEKPELIEKNIFEISSKRVFVISNKINKTPSAYPRGKNKPKIMPLH